MKIVGSTRKEISQDNSCAAKAREQPVAMGGQERVLRRMESMAKG